VCLLTDWEEFKNVNLVQLSSILHKPVLIDGRNVFTEEQIQGSGLEYYSVGRPRMSGWNRDKVEA
ncbi:UDP-glucose 6-dehydrogenase, partial [Paenibacillus sp. 28ISP30-2]|nr:UDP-glucose 6-dehydrogenase [Paenibacillus sp. 28ISP30-2]